MWLANSVLVVEAWHLRKIGLGDHFGQSHVALLVHNLANYISLVYI